MRPPGKRGARKRAGGCGQSGSRDGGGWGYTGTCRTCCCYGPTAAASGRTRRDAGAGGEPTQAPTATATPPTPRAATGSRVTVSRSRQAEPWDGHVTVANRRTLGLGLLDNGSACQPAQWARRSGAPRPGGMHSAPPQWIIDCSLRRSTGIIQPQPPWVGQPHQAAAPRYGVTRRAPTATPRPRLRSEAAGRDDTPHLRACQRQVMG